MKKTITRAGIFGAAGLGAAALVIGGIAAPALASDVDDSGNSSEQSYSGSLDSALQNTLDFLDADVAGGDTGAQVGDLVDGLTGGIDDDLDLGGLLGD
jgi:hypothetical protein